MSGAADIAAPLTLTRKDAAAFVGVAPNTFDQWVDRNILPAPVTGTKRWSREALRRAIDGEAADEELSPFEKWRRQSAAAPQGHQQGDRAARVG